MREADGELVRRIENLLQQPVYFRDLLAASRDRPYRALLCAWSEIRTRHALARDELGRYFLEKTTAD